MLPVKDITAMLKIQRFTIANVNFATLGYGFIALLSHENGVECLRFGLDRKRRHLKALLTVE